MNDSLFSFDETPEPTSSALVPPPIRDHQVAAIRKAFTESGIESQEERQSLVQSCAMRAVPSLRDLTAVEAHRVLTRLQQRATARPISGGSAWDNRDEDTWIDKL